MTTVDVIAWGELSRQAVESHLVVLPQRVRVWLACACARRVLPVWERAYPGDLRPRQALEAAERWAHHPTRKNRQLAHKAADAAFAAGAVRAVAAWAMVRAAFSAAWVGDAVDVVDAASRASWSVWCASQVGVESFDSWFTPLYLAAVGPGVAFAPEWRTTTAVALARGIYDTQDFSAMPILADALQESGCNIDNELMRLRTATEFVNSDWILTQLLQCGGGG